MVSRRKGVGEHSSTAKGGRAAGGWGLERAPVREGQLCGAGESERTACQGDERQLGRTREWREPWLTLVGFNQASIC